MAISATQIATTNTLENFRQQFNNLQTDVNGLESGTLTFSSVSATTTSTSALNILEDGTIVFEGATDNTSETTLTVADPSTDRTITLPDATGTVFLENTTDTTVFSGKSALSSGDVAGGTDVLLIADISATTLKKITVDDLISSAGGLTSLAGDSTPQLGGDLDVNGNKITSASNANVEIEPNGTGNILLDSDLITLGSGTEVGHLSTPGTQDIKLSTNSGTDSGTIVITDGANNNITLTPNGTGDVVLSADSVTVGDADAAATLTSNGAGTLTVTTGGATDLILSTNGGTNSSSLTITDAANGNVDVALNGTAVFQVDGSDGVSMESGYIYVKNGGTQSQVRFYCESSNAHYTAIQAPAHADFSGNEVVTLPNNSGTLPLVDAIILNASDGSATDAGDDLVQNTAANENDRVLLEDATVGDAAGLLSSHGLTFAHEDVTFAGAITSSSDATFTSGRVNLVDTNEAVVSDGSNLKLVSGGTTYSIPTSDGTSGQFLSTNGSGVLSFGSVTTFSWNIGSDYNSDFNAAAANGYFVDTSGGAVTATLPSSPSAGDTIRFIDLAATFDSNALTIGRNTNKIMGDTADMTVNTERAALGLVYSDSSNGWLLIEK